ncbi:ABC transporter substrate-binding protein [Thalassotalea profundi]|uniref:Periplasmic binding protein domain-containing protein n=1 Tax=Thalassotalea profundi TaxID=2036687 RepID=A0ABQ3IJP8_9GAMM|nr:ABC transporter substrate-binding protein [Thalassotalea profundi]GHE82666.1 hypothetical protein GCM10011501_08680 [Thalassotalea profundi]
MKISLLILILLHPFSAHAINITFVNPSLSGTAFWDRVTNAFLDVAHDLNINVDVVYGSDNRLHNYQAIEQIVKRETKPDYVIFMSYSGNAKATYDLLEQNQIHFVTLERTLPLDEQLTLGLPQENYKFWLGEVFHDNEKAGELLGDILIEAAIKINQGKVNTLSAVGIMGIFGGESEHRSNGFKTSIAKHKNTQLLQTVPAFWMRDTSEVVFTQLLQRYGDIDIAWAASDDMALGILKVAREQNITKKLTIGGIDWTIEAINEVRDGNLTASVGGHFMQAAWALIKIFDHHHNAAPFIKGANTSTYQLTAITSENISNYYFLTKKIDWSQVDFKKYSLVYNQQSQHDFTIERLIKLFNKRM